MVVEMSEYSRKYQREHREQLNEYYRKYYRQNREKYIENQRRRNQEFKDMLFSLSDEEFLVYTGLKEQTNEVS